MININLLERKWLNYKFKKILIFNIFVILTIIISLILYIYLFLFENNFLNKIMTKTSQTFTINNDKVEENLAQSKIIEKEKIKERKREEERIKKEKIKEEIIKEEKIKQEIREKEIIESVKNIKKIRKPYTPPAVQEKDIEKKEKKNFNIRINSKNFIFHMKKRFKSNKNPQIALTIANFYFNKKDYYRSGYWALVANKIDRRLDESWIIFAKSKVKLGKKKEALRILNSYYHNNPSALILTLIGNIKSNTLF